MNNTGNKGEQLARKYLEKHAYTIIESNFHSRFGELDIVASYNNEIVFVEVKTRNTETYQLISAEESVDKNKQQKLLRTVDTYLLHKNFTFEIAWRFDVIVVLLSKNNYRIIHYPYAFEL